MSEGVPCSGCVQRMQQRSAMQIVICNADQEFTHYFSFTISTTEMLRLEGDSGDHLVQHPCSNHCQLQRVIQDCVQSCSEYLQDSTTTLDHLRQYPTILTVKNQQKTPHTHHLFFLCLNDISYISTFILWFLLSHWVWPILWVPFYQVCILISSLQATSPPGQTVPDLLASRSISDAPISSSSSRSFDGLFLAHPHLSCTEESRTGPTIPHVASPEPSRVEAWPAGDTS